MRSKMIAGVIGVLAAVVLHPVATGAQAPATSKVTVVHGLRGRLVDVYLDGALALEGFKPDRTTEAMDIPAGPHTVDLRNPATSATSKPFASATLEVPAGKDLSVVAHLSPEGKPTITAYENKPTPATAGQGDVVVRHNAAAPPITVLFNERAVANSLANPKEIGARLDASNYAVIVKADAGTTLVPTDDVTLKDSRQTILYLVGSAEDESLTWLAQEVAQPAAPAPTAVQTGTSGLAAPDPFPTVLVVVLVTVVLFSAPRIRFPLRRR